MSKDKFPQSLSTTPLEEAYALPAEFYLGDDQLATDQSQILSNYWQYVAPASTVAEPGDHIVRQLGGKPIVIVRDDDHSLNGFLNICRHRGGPVAKCDGAGAKRLRCSYHGWAYGLDGRLRSAPEMRRAKEFNIKDISLHPMELRVWRGMIFCRMPTERAPDFDEIVSEIERLVPDTAFSDVVFHHQRDFEVGANWKIYVDNYLEGYHVPFVHPQLNKVISYAQYETEIGQWASVQRSTVEKADRAYDEGDAYYVFIFPNTMLNILKGRIQTNRVIPLASDRCRVEFEYYYSRDAVARAEADDKFSSIVQDEDKLICERIQYAYASGAYSPGRLSPDQEACVWHWQNLLRQAYAACPDAAAGRI